MKTRLHFVSNSSSSSFIICCKDNALTQDLLLQVFKIDISSPFYPFVKELSKYIIDSAFKLEDKEALEYLQYNYNKDILLKFYKKGYAIYEGSAASDSSDSLERILCEMEINYEDDQICILKESGY